jgi:hypothetical protein
MTLLEMTQLITFSLTPLLKALRIPPPEPVAVLLVTLALE